MDKIKIGEKEYTVEELQEAINKSSDYTQKTQKLAEEKRILEAEAERVKALKELDNYLTQHPDTGKLINDIIAEDVKKRYGYDINQGTTMSQHVGARQPQQKRMPRQSYTNVGYSDYTPGAVPYGGSEEEFEEDEYITKDVLEKKLKETEQRLVMSQQQQEINKEVQRQYKQLKDAGYTDEEMNKIMSTAKAKNMWLVDAAQNLAFNGNIADRFHKKEEPLEKKNLTIMRGQSGSGFELPEDEKELIEFGGDPGELLREKYAKNLIKEED